MLIGLISSSTAKTTYPAPARELFSPAATFRGALKYLTGRTDCIYVLSAKYGLMPLDQVGEPYTECLTEASTVQRAAWAHQIVASLLARYGGSLQGIAFEFHAGYAYRQPLEFYLKGEGATSTCPVEGMRPGERVAFYGSTPLPHRAVTPPPTPAPPAPLTPEPPAPTPVTEPPAPTPAPGATDPLLEAFLSILPSLELHTPTGARFHVTEVGPQGVVVVPMRTGEPRAVPAAELSAAYELLRRSGRITLDEVRRYASVTNPAYVFAILARLPGARITEGPLHLVW